MSKRAIPIPEAAFRLEVDGRTVASWTCTPHRLRELSAGWILSAGLADTPHEIDAITIDASRAVARVRLTGGAAAALAGRLQHRAHVGCGIRHFLDCERTRLRPSPTGDAGPAPDGARAAELLRKLYAHADQYREHGGLHVAALVDGRDALIASAEETGRHNAVDKVVGDAWLRGVDLRGCGLVLSARVSGAIALKAARAGLGWIVSRSVPTTLALEFAGASDVTIIARAGGDHARVFPPQHP